VVHDENFEMVQISKSEAKAAADLEKMLDKLFISAHWQHTDAYTDNDSTVASHYYFDNSWDLAYQQAQADCQRKHENRQAHGSSCKRTRDLSTPSPAMPSSEGAPHQASRAQVPAIDSPPSGRSSHSDLSAPLSTASKHEGAESSDALSETSTRHIISDPPDSYERTSDDTAELATQCHHEEIEASPILVPARTPLGDDIASPDADDIIHIVSQLGSIGSPAKQPHLSGTFSDAKSETFLLDIMLQHLQAMVSHFDKLGETVPYSSHSNKMLDFKAIQSIIDKQNITFDGVSIDGIFNSDNPLAFAAGTKNNPDILSQAQMLKAPDVDLFLDSQQPEIQGLCDADVFEFQNISSLPSGAHLLNAIWSY
jgi:hypothetical protein